jgi:hypothetical protein
MAVLDTAEANRLLEAIVGRTAYTATVGPLKMRLTTVTGTDAAAGTEVTGGSYIAGGQPVTTWNAAASRAITNSTALSYTGMPASTVTGVDFYDQAGTPVRKLYGNLGASKTVAAGDTLSFASGAISASFT